MSMEYIREYYAVPAKRGGKLKYSGGPGGPVEMEIIGSRGAYLKCRILEVLNAGLKTLVHPT
jgi:hypothetical protein